MKKSPLTIVALGLLTASAAAQAQGYDYESIDFPGTSNTQVFGINERGDVVGNGFGGGTIFPFVYDTMTGTFTSVAPVAGFDDTSVLGITDNGDLAGEVLDTATGISSGLIIDKNGASTVFDHPDAVFLTQPRAINNRGLVTGFRDSEDDLAGPENGFIYDPHTDTFTDIVPSLFTIAQGINERGDVVGSAIFFNADDPCPPTPGGTVRYGWLRTTDGNITYFSVNGGRTSARGISDSGTIVGFVTDITTGETKSYVTEIDGTQCQDIGIADADLLEFPGADLTFVQDITNSGVVSGIYVDAANVSHGFVATPQ